MSRPWSCRQGRSAAELAPGPAWVFLPALSSGSLLMCFLSAYPVSVSTHSSGGAELPEGGEGQWEHCVPRLHGPCAGVTLPSSLSSHQNANGEVTDFLSFYTLPSTIMNHPTHKSLKAAYSFYNVHTQTPLLDLMSDALVLAKMVRSRPEGWGGAEHGSQ